MKFFDQEIRKLYDRLTAGQKFSFSKYADGEWFAMTGKNVNNGEFTYKDSIEHKKAVSALKQSFQYKHNEYYVGISCPCCQGNDHKLMKSSSEQDEEHLTFANIFVNSNYSWYCENFLPVYKNFQIHLVAHKNSRIENLPFKVDEFYPIEYDAWIHNLDLIEKIGQESYKDKLFLFCAGPFGNILAHRLWDANQNNTYIDIGSTLNPWLMSEGFKRGYLSGANTKQKVCIWES
jgi:hypothetical protein